MRYSLDIVASQPVQARSWLLRLTSSKSSVTATADNMRINCTGMSGLDDPAGPLRENRFSEIGTTCSGISLEQDELYTATEAVVGSVPPVQASWCR